MESSLLRLAIAKGLLRWEDLDAVAEHLPADGGNGDVSQGRWVRGLLDAGLLTDQDVERLTAELQGAREDATPDYGGLPFQPAPPAASPPPPSPFPPELRFLADWPRYRVERLLGSGGMGTVYKAFDPTLGRWVALKFLHRNDGTHAERFLREARAQARISHPNVCHVHEVGEAEGRPYIAMQYIDGRSLGELCEELTLDDKVRLVRDVARAIHAAHRTGLIHRDLKPGNILLARDENGEIHPFVVDFGLAMAQDEISLSRTGMISGTPAYISPEQAQGRPLDRRTDVYSLGVVLYELLAGEPPFTGGNLARVLVSLVQEDPRPLRQAAPATPEDLETIVAKCLEKDPTRRYESARELAEDLDRFLDGEPIRARPAGWVYRAGKRLRKHRALAAVSITAVLALAALGAFSLHAQWRARERARLAQRFGQRIGSFKASMEYVATQPLHDITPYKRQLEAEMGSIRAEMKEIGPIAEGPGRFALGQGYLSLHQYDLARDQLERAWKADERGPEVAEALGIAFGRSYERSLASADRSPSSETRFRLEEIEHTYRDPALKYLRRALLGSPDASFLHGLIAYYEGRYADALAAVRRDPGSPQGARLEARIYLSQGSDAARAGEYEQADRLFVRAGEIYARLAQRFPSDPDLYLEDCERQTRQVLRAIANGKAPDEGGKERLAACGRALLVDPGMSDALVLEAVVVWRQGAQERKRGNDPTARLAEAVRLLERALALEPHNARAYPELASAHLVLAQWQIEHGANAGHELVAGIEAARKAVEMQPGMASAHSSLGSAHLLLAHYQQRQGTDPRPELLKAAESLQQASVLSPRLLSASFGLGNTWNVMAEAQIARGEDPSRSIGQAVAALERAAGLNPRAAPIYNTLGNTHLTFGEYLLARGDDPRQAFDRAAASYRRGIALMPDDPLAHYNLGYTWRSLGEALLSQKQDPRPALAQAAPELDTALRLSPGDAEVFLERARIQRIVARWRLQQRQDPGPDLRDALAELNHAEALNPRQADVLFTQALIARDRAGLARDARARAAVLQEGLERTGKALDVNPGEARYLALRGQLEEMSARLEADPNRRQELARRALAALEAALKANPLLQREYGDALADARLDARLDEKTVSPRPRQL
ncbi:MAG TPA: protein kinase [Thermoanaerobaculia bacterium]